MQKLVYNVSPIKYKNTYLGSGSGSAIRKSSMGSTDLFHLVEVGGSKPLVSVKEEDFGGMLRITTGKAEVFSGKSQLSQVSSWTAIRTGHF